MSKGISSLAPVFKNARERFMSKNYYPVGLPSVVTKILEKPVVICFLITSKNVTFCLVSSMVSGFLAQLKTLLHLYLIELLGYLIGLSKA